MCTLLCNIILNRLGCICRTPLPSHLPHAIASSHKPYAARDPNRTDSHLSQRHRETPAHILFKLSASRALRSIPAATAGDRRGRRQRSGEGDSGGDGGGGDNGGGGGGGDRKARHARSDPAHDGAATAEGRGGRGAAACR